MLKVLKSSSLSSRSLEIHIVELADRVYPKTNSARMMKKDELQEKHLQEALLHTSAIPTPEVVEIDEEIYQRLYKTITQKMMPKRRILTIFNETDDPCEYDCDTADTSWLESWTRDHSGTSLTVENFEKTMEFLEDNSQETVPSIDMLNLRKFTKKREAGAIYDYWLDKRLKTRKRLVPHFKRGGKWRSFDPFVAFRPCEEKMRTRKNRAADHNKYSKLLKIRSWLDGYANSLKDMRNQEIQRHNSLVQKLYEFSAQYKSNSLQDEFLEWMNWPQSGTETVKIEECPSSEDECELKTLVDDQTVDSDYLKPIESNILDDEHGFFRISQSYLIRRRVGRGGRIIIDRRTDSSNYKKMEVAFKSMNINPTVDCWKFSFMLEQCDTSSVFKLKDTCVDENIEYNKVEFEEI